MKIEIIETSNKYVSNLKKNQFTGNKIYINKELKDVKITSTFTKCNLDCEYNYLQSVIISE